MTARLGSPDDTAVLVARRGTTLFASDPERAGPRQGSPVGIDTVFDVGSSAQLLTAVALLRLVEEGRLRLDAPVVRLLPELSGWGEAITARHLLQHTAGLPERLARSGAERDQPATPFGLSGVEAMAAQLRVSGLAFQPGTRLEESTLELPLTALLLEKSSGMPIAALMESRVFGFCGMTNSAVAKRAPSGVAIDSTVQDLARFDRALMGGHLLRAASMGELFAPGRLADGEPLDYGLGWRIVDDPESGERGFLQEGEGHGLRWCYLRVPRAELSVLILTRRFDLEVDRLAFAIAALFRNSAPPAGP